MAASPITPPRLLPSGDSAVTVEFSKDIDDAANQRVLALDRALTRDPIAGVTEAVPTYRSLLVHYDPVAISFDALGEKLKALAQHRCRSDQGAALADSGGLWRRTRHRSGGCGESVGHHA